MALGNLFPWEVSLEYLRSVISTTLSDLKQYELVEVAEAKENLECCSPT